MGYNTLSMALSIGQMVLTLALVLSAIWFFFNGARAFGLYVKANKPAKAPKVEKTSSEAEKSE